jgi:hypothetical protein
MTIKILATLAIAATMFSACSESTTPPPSKASQCAAGLSADCVLGTWSLNGPTVKKNYGEDTYTTIDPSHNFEASPATLKFYIDEKQANKFHFTNSPLSSSNCPVINIYGDWNIVGSSIYLYARIGNECMAQNDATVPVEISAAGEIVTMTFKQMFFMEPEMKQADKLDQQNTTEIYTFVSAN